MPLYREGLVLACRIGDRRRAAFCLEGLGQSLAGTKPERAALCFSVAQHMREVIASPLPPSEKQLCDQAIERIKDSLNTSIFETTWQRGQTIPVDEVVAKLRERV